MEQSQYLSLFKLLRNRISIATISVHERERGGKNTECVKLEGGVC